MWPTCFTNVIQVAYICFILVIQVAYICFHTCNTGGLHMFHTCITGGLHVFHTCNTGDLHVFHTCNTCGLHMFHTCNTGGLHMFHTCNTGVYPIWKIVLISYWDLPTSPLMSIDTATIIESGNEHLFVWYTEHSPDYNEVTFNFCIGTWLHCNCWLDRDHT